MNGWPLWKGWFLLANDCFVGGHGARLGAAGIGSTRSLPDIQGGHLCEL
jgi:hypothetical protein